MYSTQKNLADHLQKYEVTFKKGTALKYFEGQSCHTGTPLDFISLQKAGGMYFWMSIPW